MIWRLVWKKILLAFGEDFFGGRKMEVFAFGGFLFSFPTTTNTLTQLVGFWTSSMISKSTIRFNSFSNLGFKGRGILLTRDTAWVTLSLISLWWVFLRVPISPKQSENLDKNCSSFPFRGYSMITSCKRGGWVSAFSVMLRNEKQGVQWYFMKVCNVTLKKS